MREECYAIALERMVLPATAFALAVEATDAYLYALHRVSTDLATGWFRDFAIDHFPQLATPDRDYVGRFEAACAAGDVRMKATLPIAPDVRDALSTTCAGSRRAGISRACRDAGSTWRERCRPDRRTPGPAGPHSAALKSPSPIMLGCVACLGETP